MMTTVTMTPVESKQIEAIGYDAASRTLRVRFRGFKGKPSPSYDYAAVPAEVHQRFMSAPSKGRFLDAEIKGKFEFRKLDPAELAA